MVRLERPCDETVGALSHLVSAWPSYFWGGRRGLSSIQWSVSSHNETLIKMPFSGAFWLVNTLMWCVLGGWHAPIPRGEGERAPCSGLCPDPTLGFSSFMWQLMIRVLYNKTIVVSISAFQSSVCLSKNYSTGNGKPGIWRDSVKTAGDPCCRHLRLGAVLWTVTFHLWGLSSLWGLVSEVNHRRVETEQSWNRRKKNICGAGACVYNIAPFNSHL